jgi:hypothetical protein
VHWKIAFKSSQGIVRQLGGRHLARGCVEPMLVTGSVSQHYSPTRHARHALSKRTRKHTMVSTTTLVAARNLALDAIRRVSTSCAKIAHTNKTIKEGKKNTFSQVVAFAAMPNSYR